LCSPEGLGHAPHQPRRWCCPTTPRPGAHFWTISAWSRAWSTHAAVVTSATTPPPDSAGRDLTVGEAVHAIALDGRGCLNQARSLVPRVVPHQPPSRRMSPRVASQPCPEDALGRALELRDALGVTARDSLLAATTVPRLGRAPRVGQRDRPRLQVDGRDNRDAAPEAPVMHRTRGARRDQRADRPPVLRDVRVAPQAGLPVLMPPRRGHQHGPRTTAARSSPPLWRRGRSPLARRAWSPTLPARGQRPVRHAPRRGRRGALGAPPA
jgi:hypothetical protein